MSNISIITTCCNDLDELIATCNSIDIQSEKPYEHWIINYSSGYQIEEWINNNPQPSYRKWLHEAGIQSIEACNKGISTCKGDIVHILASGDKYNHVNVIQEVKKVFNADCSLKWVNGKLKLRSNSKDIIIGKSFENKKLFKGFEGVYQPTWFVKKEVYERVGLFNKNHIYSKDYDMLCRISSEKHQYINLVMVEYFDWGYNEEHYYRFINDNLKIYEGYFGKSFKASLWHFILKIKYRFFE